MDEILCKPSNERKQRARQIASSHQETCLFEFVVDLLSSVAETIGLLVVNTRLLYKPIP